MLENLEFREVVRLAGVGFFYLLILMLCLLYFGDNIQKFYFSWFPKSHPTLDESKEKLPPDELLKQQKAAREKIQDEHTLKAESFNERILKPKEEAKKAELEKEFYRNAGPAWKGKGERTRPRDDNDDSSSGNQETRPAPRKRDLEGTNRDAAAARKLPESVTNPPKRAPAEPPKAKVVITLPDEPEEGTPKSITVALRGTASIVKRRRFLFTEKVQVLLNWMSKLGYHQKLYTLVMTYPRQDLSQHATDTLEEAGIDHDVALVVEEILPEEES
ncbi:UBX domain-containing protein 8-like [Strongylocentrotus purpuratus]|uniref:UBX domain-containing protein n=1 Tax=Strongylocentrotus purpuratus TaxID=7668 RepID=A0A7M7NE51_STRPU|nr:UBX domain-containing protein 8-like [Strongylocentrotus purpuratus]